MSEGKSREAQRHSWHPFILSPREIGSLHRNGVIGRLTLRGMILATTAGCLVAVEPIRRMESLIGRHVADLFVFSVLKNDPDRTIQPRFAAHTASSIRTDRIGRP